MHEMMRIQIEDLHFVYPSGVVALNGVTLAIEAGERVAIIGQNGAGKTTLAKHLNGLLRPQRGAVRVGDWRTSDHSVAKLAAWVGYVFQNPDDQLFKRDVRSEVAFGPTNLGYPPEHVEALVRDALALLDLNDKATTNPYDLNPTWRRRVALAAVLAMNPPIIVLDEPTTGQDYRSLQQLGDLIVTLQRAGKTVIAISHDMDFVADHFDRIVVMRQGQIILEGPPASVFGQVELLETTYVQPPQLARLGQRLGFERASSTADDFLSALSRVGVGLAPPDTRAPDSALDP